MTDETPRLGLNVYEFGDQEWNHEDTVKTLDELAVQTGVIADRPDEGHYDDELYGAVDQRILWRWDANQEDWLPFSGLGTEDEPVPGEMHVESLRADQQNGIFIPRSDEELQATIDRAAENTWSSRRGAVALRPYENYTIDEEVVLRSNVTLLGNGSSVKAMNDTNLIYAEPRSNIIGPLELDTSAVNGYTSTALLLDGERAEEPYRLRTRKVVTVTGPVTLYGGGGEGTGLRLRTVDDGYITHCRFDLMIRGFDTQIHCDTPGGFANSNIVHIEAVPVDTDKVFYHSGTNEAKLICFGHVQSGNASEVFVNETGRKSVRFWGHVEDPHWVDGNVARGDNMTLKTTAGVRTVGQEWDLGIGTTIDGIGREESNSETPTAGAWNVGSIVAFTDLEDGSGSGTYLKHIDGSWIQLESTN
ncbi:hypothetical protein [Natronoglomus mannanivorans]|uniref:Uncharacterized protein n=1 Tax=Natronoglomus mannanivorans TaxID=2979990 RepID=A0AAP3E433_9EURY|nr:hypothetical protein [Halobacteria archaeon AArc-xg1-1]